MKRSFYEMLGVTHDADQAQIDTAYALATAKMGASNTRGVNEAVSELQLIREGYQMLSDPARRAKYDAKLAASESGVQLMFFPEDRAARRRLGLDTVIFAALAAVLGGVIYYQLSHKMDEVRVEHVQAVTRQKGDQNKVITVDMAQPETSVASAGSKEPKQ